MSKHGIVPPDDELATLLDTLSKEHYNGLYIPGGPLYDSYKPPGWRTSRAVCRAHGLPADRRGWRKLVARLGLCTPVATRGVTWNPDVHTYRIARRFENFMDDTFDWRTERLAAHHARHTDGMTAIVRRRPVRAWCIHTKRYVTIGHRITYELR